jgi:hypothetical protein
LVSNKLFKAIRYLSLISLRDRPHSLAGALGILTSLVLEPARHDVVNEVVLCIRFSAALAENGIDLAS